MLSRVEVSHLYVRIQWRTLFEEKNWRKLTQNDDEEGNKLTESLWLNIYWSVVCSISIIIALVHNEAVLCLFFFFNLPTIGPQKLEV